MPYPFAAKILSYVADQRPKHASRYQAGEAYHTYLRPRGKGWRGKADPLYQAWQKDGRPRGHYDAEDYGWVKPKPLHRPARTGGRRNGPYDYDEPMYNRLPSRGRSRQGVSLDGRQPRNSRYESPDNRQRPWVPSLRPRRNASIAEDIPRHRRRRHSTRRNTWNEDDDFPTRSRRPLAKPPPPFDQDPEYLAQRRRSSRYAPSSSTADYRPSRVKIRDTSPDIIPPRRKRGGSSRRDWGGQHDGIWDDLDSDIYARNRDVRRSRPVVTGYGDFYSEPGRQRKSRGSWDI